MKIRFVRLVWALIPLVLMGFIGIDESFAEQASGKPAWITNSEKVCGDRLCSEIQDKNIVKEIQESFSEESSLKKQLAKNVSLSEISCPDNNHVLVERSNEKLACVTPYTMAKMQWNPTDNSFWSKITKNEEPFAIFSHLSETQKVNGVKFNKDMNSLIVHVTSGKSEKLSMNINRAILDVRQEGCGEIPDWPDYIVLINGEEVAFEQKLKTKHFRYLEIDIHSQQEKNLSEKLRVSKEVHNLHEISYHEDSKIIEIIGICYT